MPRMEHKLPPMDNSILVVGSVALDTVRTPFGEAEEVLGGSATYFSIAASYFAKVRVVAVVGTDFPPAHTEFLESRGVDIGGLTKVEGRTFRWKGLYGNDINQAQTLDVQLNVFEKFSPVLSAAYRKSRYLFLANIDPDLQEDILRQARSPELVACDTMNHWIEQKREGLKKILRKVDILLINEGEARQLSGEHNGVKAARSIMKMGPGTVVVKRGEYGAVCASRLMDEVFAVPAYPLENVRDATGAGDSFAGGFMGNLARRGRFSQNTLRESIVFGNMLGSFCVEDFSLGRYMKLKLSDIEKRYRAFKKSVHF
jgi:sugar/nucleoside kinase (ribokinase family)